MSSKDPKTDDATPMTAGDELLQQTVYLLRPLIDLLIQQDVGYPSLARALRTGFVEAARDQLANEGSKTTDAAVSLRSGVHRKEVKALGEEHGQSAQRRQPGRSLSVAEQVFTRWTTDATFKTARSEPATLPLTGPAPSFDALVLSVTRDFSRRTILDELIRIGLVKLRDDQVIPLSRAVVPAQAVAELTQYLGNHLHDHLAAGAANISAASRRENPPFLEHSMYANGLSDLSVEQLSTLAAELWKPAFNQMVGAARQRYDLDKEEKHTGRMRFGVYLFSEADQPDEADQVRKLDTSNPATGKGRSKKKKSRSRKSDNAK